MTPKRALRIALIADGRITDERVVDFSTTITIGPAMTDTFFVAEHQLARSVTVFERRALRRHEALSGKLHGAFGVMQVERGTSRVVSLEQVTHGRLALGELTLVFQSVEHRPAQRLELPKELRANWVTQVDRLFLAVLIISLGATFSGAGYLVSQPLPESDESLIEEASFRPTRLASRVPVKTPVASAAASTNAAASAPRRAPSQTELRNKARTAGIIGAIGQDGAGLRDMLTGLGGADMVRALEGANGRSDGVMQADGPRGDARGRAATIGAIETEGVKQVELIDQRKTPPPASIVSLLQVEVEDDINLGEELSRWMRTRKTAIRDCYERELKRSPTLHGRMMLRFSVTPRGRISDVSVTEDTLQNAQVETCLRETLARWVVPFHPEDDVSIGFPLVFAAAP